jgi:hypothetical protein
MNARNREAFLELWENRWRGNPKYLDENGEPEAQANRLFERSGLLRSKWRDRKNSGGGKHSYGEVTIFNASEFSTYQKARKTPGKSER